MALLAGRRDLVRALVAEFVPELGLIHQRRSCGRKNRIFFYESLPKRR